VLVFRRCVAALALVLVVKLAGDRIEITAWVDQNVHEEEYVCFIPCALVLFAILI